MEDNGYELWCMVTGNMVSYSESRHEILQTTAMLIMHHHEINYALDGPDIDAIGDHALVDLLFREGYLSEAQRMELLL